MPNNSSKNPSAKQRIASNPNTSVWVSASAGTGKTKILVDRLLRLLLNGINVDNILCITYSKAAAQEMINRLMEILSKWSIVEEEALIKQIEDISGNMPTNDQITIAKELFSKIINHPRELKIQTIHSFCQNLLARFPIEANIPTNFLVIEDDISHNIKNQAIEKVLSDQMEDSKTNGEIETLLEGLIKNISQHSFENIIKNILNYSEKLELISFKYNIKNSLDSIKNEIYNYLQADIKLDSKELLINYINNINVNNLEHFINLFKKKDLFPTKLNIETLESFIKLPNHEKLEKFTQWKSFFLTLKDEPKTSLLNKEVLKKLDSDAPFITNTISEITQDLLELLEQQKAQVCAELNFAIIRVSLHIYREYQHLKYNNGYLDYSDLIMKTYELLSNPSLSQWIMYKLDQKIDHILVDEAQDTSPMQWEIIKSLLEDFFSGESSKVDINRSIFVVGDIKQSIYSFQGADPYSFSKTREFLAEKIQNANKPFVQIAMNTSFRSSSGVIDMVNHVSKNIFDITKAPYLSEEINHNVFHSNKPFNVEVWPLIHVDKKSDANGDKFQNLAQAIVKKIEILNTQGITFGDILILYRTRKNNITLEYIVKLLKDKNIPVLGIDKINLKNNIAVADLIALAKFLSQTKDSFSLCCVLKSPMFNLSDDDIFNIIHFDSTKDAFFNLSTTHPQIYTTLLDWLNMVDYKSIFDLFFHILYKEDSNGEQNITKFISRLGFDVIDPLSEFINLIFIFKQKQDDNLQSFIKFLENYDSEISREVSNNKDSVNLMSIHSSKGLQSKVVFLLNDLDKKSPKKDILFNNNMSNPLLLISPKKEMKCKAIKNLEENYKTLEQEESKRLLYVAITRAEEHLYIASISNNEDIAENIDTKNKDSHLWWNSINNELDAIFLKEEDSFFKQNLGFVSQNVYRTKSLYKNTLPPIQKTKIDIPTWVNKPAPIEPTPSKPLTPSKLLFEEEYFNSPLQSIKLNKNNAIINKGSLIHKILEQINYINIKEHDLFVDSFITAQNQLSDDDKIEVKNNINNIIKNQNFNFLFDNKTLNEVSLSGMVSANETLQLVSARVDKLIITENEVIIIEYKYSKIKKSIAIPYQKQINLYKKLLQDIYPKHIIRGFILFSQSADIIEIK